MPEADVGGAVGVVVEGVGISSAFVGNNAFAASLIPAVLSAPCTDILHALGSTAVASWAVARWAVTSAAVSDNEGQDGHQDNNELHVYLNITPMCKIPTLIPDLQF